MAKEKELEIDLPFDSNKNRVIISQGFNSPFSHKPFDSIDLTHSVDFALEPETEITAVQDGIVKAVQLYDDCYRGYDAKKGRSHWASSLEIWSKENEKLYALMQHLNPESINIRKGHEVTRGQVIATTGLTGWVGPIPHLHLSMIDTSVHPRRSIPFKFRGRSLLLNDEDIEKELITNVRVGLYLDPLGEEILKARDEARRVMIP